MSGLRITAAAAVMFGVTLAASHYAVAQQAPAAASAKAESSPAAAKPEPKAKERRKCRRDTSSADGMMGSVICETEAERQARGTSAASNLERNDAKEYLRQQQMMGDYRPK